MGVEDIYRTAILKSIKDSIKHYEPVRIKGFIEFRIHKWLWRIKQENGIIPLPDGVRAAEAKFKAKNHNTRRDAGSFLMCTWRNRLYFGISLKQCGKESIIFKPVMVVTPHLFRSSQRYQWEMYSGKNFLLNKRHYSAKGSLWKWVDRRVGRIDPILTPAQCYRMLKDNSAVV